MIPCPISTLPGETTTSPAAPKLTHDDSLGFAMRLAGSVGEEGVVMIGLPSHSQPRARRAPCGYVRHSGSGCGCAMLPRPSSVVISLSATDHSGVSQEVTA